MDGRAAVSCLRLYTLSFTLIWIWRISSSELFELWVIVPGSKQNILKHYLHYNNIFTKTPWTSCHGGREKGRVQIAKWLVTNDQHWWKLLEKILEKLENQVENHRNSSAGKCNCFISPWLYRSLRNVSWGYLRIFFFLFK